MGAHSTPWGINTFRKMILYQESMSQFCTSIFSKVKYTWVDLWHGHSYGAQANGSRSCCTISPASKSCGRKQKCNPCPFFAQRVGTCSHSNMWHSTTLDRRPLQTSGDFSCLCMIHLLKPHQQDHSMTKNYSRYVFSIVHPSANTRLPIWHTQLLQLVHISSNQEPTNVKLGLLGVSIFNNVWLWEKIEVTTLPTYLL